MAESRLEEKEEKEDKTELRQRSDKNEAASDAFSIAGGGDTLAAIEQFGVTDAISYISTGGGAFLEFVEGKTLPAIAALEALTDKGN